MNNLRAFTQKPLVKELLIPVAIWLLLSLVFSLAYTQSHLYNDNQNTKFLHGLAMGGMGLLKEDWLANTADPLPVFSLLVSFTYAFLAERLFYVYFALLMGVYAYSILGIVSTLYAMNRLPAKYLAYFVVILAIHSIQGQIFARKALGFDLEILHFGLAGQYLLGLDFQNSSFGVFLLLSIHAYLKRKTVWAILWLSLASIFHSAYLFSAALMTLAYLGDLFYENMRSGKQPADSPSHLEAPKKGQNDQQLPPYVGRIDNPTATGGGLPSRPTSFWTTPERSNEGMTLIRRVMTAAKSPVLLGLLALILVSPVVIYQQVALSSTSPELSAQALDILVNQRIPHHTLPRVWMDSGAYLQIAIMLGGLLLVRKTRLFPVMLALTLGGALGSFAQVLTGSNSLALMGPWRVSVILVPLSTCLLIAWPVGKFFDRFARQVESILPVVVILCLAGIVYLGRAGLEIQRGRFSRYERMDAHPMMYYVRQDKAPGQVYLIPPRDNRFDEFRTFTGAPAFINWKSHPYRDFEVLEWYNRNMLARQFYTNDQAIACQTLARLTAEYTLTHVVVDLEGPHAVCDGMQETYRDQHYAVYALVNQ